MRASGELGHLSALALILTAAACVPGAGAFDSRATGGDVELPDAGASSEGGGDNGDGGELEVDGGGEERPTTGMLPVVGLTISEVAIYQGVKKTLVGTPQSDVVVPVVAGRDALVRVFATRDASFNGRPVTARLTIDDNEPLEVRVEQVAAEAIDEDLDSTINFDLPGELIISGSQFRVDLLQPAAEVGEDNPAATYPPDGGMEALGAEALARPLTIVLVPVIYEGRAPDTSAEQLDLFRQGFSDQYPTAQVDISVRSESVTFEGTVAADGEGFSSVLNLVASVRGQDGVPGHVYYFGVFRPTDTQVQFCGGGCVAGLGFVPGRASVGLGFSGFSAVETALHEVGHNHGRQHAPCGTSGDGGYPHEGGRIGVWGYRLSSGSLVSPTRADFMGYCSGKWVSDYTFAALFQRMKVVGGQALFMGPTQTWRRVLIHPNGSTEELESVELAAPGGSIRAVSAIDSSGTAVEVEGYLHAFDHFEGGIFFYPSGVGPLSSVALVGDGSASR